MTKSRRPARSLRPGIVEERSISRVDPRADPNSQLPPDLDAEGRAPRPTIKGDDRTAASRRQVAALQSQLAQLQNELATELQARADDAERFEELESQIQSTADELKLASACIADLQTQLETAQQRAATAEARVNELEREAEGLKAELEIKASTVTEVEGARDRALEEGRTLTARIDELEGRVASEQQAREADRLERVRVDGDLEAARTNVRGLEEQLATAKARIEEQGAQLVDVRLELEVERDRASQASQSLKNASEESERRSAEANRWRGVAKSLVDAEQQLVDARRRAAEALAEGADMSTKPETAPPVSEFEMDGERVTRKPAISAIPTLGDVSLDVTVSEAPSAAPEPRRPPPLPARGRHGHPTMQIEATDIESEVVVADEGLGNG